MKTIEQTAAEIAKEAVDMIEIAAGGVMDREFIKMIGEDRWNAIKEVVKQS